MKEPVIIVRNKKGIKGIFNIYESTKEIENKLGDSLEVIGIDSVDKYISLLKVIGSNFKQSFANQVSIANKNLAAKAVLSYNKWEKSFDRIVKKGEKAIDILVTNKDKSISIAKVFDISQTIEKDSKNIIDVPIWKLKENTAEKVFNVYLGNEGLNIDKADFDISTEEKASMLIVNKIYERADAKKLIEKGISPDFIFESVKVAIDEKLPS